MSGGNHHRSLLAPVPPVNHLGAMDCLKNQYSVMRHGQSKANLRGIIVSHIETDAGGDYGLSDFGREQVLAAAGASALPRGTLIYSSDFARAAQTAQLVQARLHSPGVVLSPALRERDFGTWEGTPSGNYRHVWAADEAGGTAPGTGVESVHAVLDRATALIAELERQHSGRDILLVSHGDTLQILQAGFGRTDPAGHRGLPHLETAQIRRMRLAADGLPWERDNARCGDFAGSRGGVPARTAQGPCGDRRADSRRAWGGDAPIGRNDSDPPRHWRCPGSGARRVDRP
jgi:probable phosphoglycerate mutase